MGQAGYKRVFLFVFSSLSLFNLNKGKIKDGRRIQQDQLWLGVFCVCVFERKDTEHSEKASSAVKPQREA